MVLGSFAVNILIVRLLPPGDVGLYFLLISMVGAGVVLGQFGLKKTVVRLVSSYLATEDKSKAAQIALSCLKVGLLASSFVALLFGLGGSRIFSVVFDVKVNIAIIAIGATWIFFRAMKEIIGETFRGYHLIKEASLFSGASEQVFYALFLSLLFIGIIEPDLFSVMSFGVVAAVLSVVLAVRQLYPRIARYSESTDDQIPQIINMALPFFVSGTVLFVFTQVDIWAIGATQSKEEVAIYAAVKRLLFSIFIPLAIINDILPPLISELFEKKQLEKLENMLRGVAFIAALPAMMVLGLFIFEAEGILGFVFGTYYRAGADILIILSLGQVINVMTGSCSNVLAMTGHQSLIMRVNLVTGALTIAACVIIANIAGSVGVAITIAVMTAGQNLVMLVLAKRKVGVWSHVGKPMLAIGALAHIYNQTRKK